MNGPVHALGDQPDSQTGSSAMTIRRHFQSTNRRAGAPPTFFVLVRELAMSTADVDDGTQGGALDPLGASTCEVLTYAEDERLVATECSYGSVRAVAADIAHSWARRGHQVRWHNIDAPPSSAGYLDTVHDVALHIDPAVTEQAAA